MIAMSPAQSWEFIILGGALLISLVCIGAQWGSSTMRSTRTRYTPRRSSDQIASSTPTTPARHQR